MLSPAWRLAVLVELRGAAGAAWICTLLAPSAVPSASTLAPQDRRDVWRVSLTLVRLAELSVAGEKSEANAVIVMVAKITCFFIYIYL